MPATFCEDCKRPYGRDGWVDVNIPDKAWAQIADPGAVLCLYCMTSRLEAKDLTDVPISVTSGPYKDLSASWFDEGWVKGNKVGYSLAADEVHRKRLHLKMARPSRGGSCDEALEDLENALRVLSE